MDDRSLPLDVVGYIEGATKSSLWIDYLNHYERHIAPYKDRDIELLEIGVFDGASLAVWKRYFPRAKIIGIDINPKCKQYEDDRATIEIGSQDDPEFLAMLVRKYSPTIIIDDGSHQAHHVIYSFERLFPFLQPGGLYVVEDMFLHADQRAERYRGPATITPPEYFLDISRMLVREGMDPADSHGDRAHYRKTIDEIAFVPNGAAFIRKKAPVDAAELIRHAETYAQQVGQAAHWTRVAHFVRRKGGSLQQAQSAARKAIELAPDNADAHLELSHIQSSTGDIDGAIYSAQRATELAPSRAPIWHHLGLLLIRKDEPGAGETALRKAISVSSTHYPSYEALSKLLIQRGSGAEAKVALQQALASSPDTQWTETFETALRSLGAGAPRTAVDG